MNKPIDFVPDGSWLTFIKQTVFIEKRSRNSGLPKQKSMAIYMCKCGKMVEYPIKLIKSGGRYSCGCSKFKPNKKNEKHGLSKHPLYRVWATMKNRCYNEKEPAYKDYGFRGVKICDQWVNNPQAFIEWGLKNGYKKGLQLDKDIRAKELGIPALLYSPETCLFVSQKQNCNQRRSSRIIEYNGQLKTLAQWSEITGLNFTTIKSRLDLHKYSVEEALTLPVGYRIPNKRLTKYNKKK